MSTSPHTMRIRCERELQDRLAALAKKKHIKGMSEYARVELWRVVEAEELRLGINQPCANSAVAEEVAAAQEELRKEAPATTVEPAPKRARKRRVRRGKAS